MALLIALGLTRLGLGLNELGLLNSEATMNFSDLMSLPYKGDYDHDIDLDAILNELPETPREVARQLYSEHGRNKDFQDTYGLINISQIKWVKVSERAEIIVASSMNPDFDEWFRTAAGRVGSFTKKGWECIHTRKDVQEHWKEFKTWDLPPVTISAALVGLKSPLHLVEGHSRVGLLAGLIQHEILPKQSMHHIWLGTANMA
ncbi:MAG: hypothetical protein NT086_12795 [Proteobacteria bacterium]|nr:hypothetical protein [Pseudomonadota bacterium]